VSLPERIASHPVVLRALVPADAPRVAELCGDWEVARMTALIPHPYPPAAAESWIAGCREADAAGEPCTYAITRAADGLLVGAIGLAAPSKDGDSFGYWVGRPYWGNGYATAAARAVIALAFSRLDIDTLQAIHLARNPASGRVMAKCGMSAGFTSSSPVVGFCWPSHREGMNAGINRYAARRRFLVLLIGSVPKSPRQTPWVRPSVSSHLCDTMEKNRQ
jgi:RimJ/RimL family protein N-acetyltransferase